MRVLTRGGGGIRNDGVNVILSRGNDCAWSSLQVVPQVDCLVLRHLVDSSEGNQRARTLTVALGY